MHIFIGQVANKISIKFKVNLLALIQGTVLIRINEQNWTTWNRSMAGKAREGKNIIAD